ncbi:MAG: type II toxin-antitoxin system mRNA interferase toxin, RelE/StbE family [Nitrospirae bacterium]|nr:type II toxin-antitoxin system mRNA interferase toxin, RelE/StbE family [Nitrospirota bacterium]MBI3378900.1 type II toxin-antitoxin system mRNA interferase toxin, RelE/StbE family [Nitrospirota bacterium]
MKRRLEYSPTYLKKAKKIAKKNPQLKGPYTELLNKLADNPLDPALHTHALTGELKGKYACSLTYELRVVFKLYDDIVHLLDIGSHDEVY